MENLSHSFLKRSYGGNGFGTAAHKSVYDDVFGGPPKFGMPTLAPRLEDYSEIFGGFHSARGSSIPILDLPVVEEVELCLDVRSSGFDYSEVFGGSHGLDFALSLDDFLRKSNGRDDPSDDAWSPAESESSSYDTDPSAFSDRSQSFANEDTHYPLSGIRQFDTSYNKANQRSNGKILNLDTPVAQLHAIPAVACMIDENHVSQKVEGPTLQTPSELKSNMGFDGGTAADKKTISLPRMFDFGRHERDCSPVEKYSGSGFLQNKPFITVNDINLQTKPSRLPPPSRPPPVYDVEEGGSAKLNSKMKDARSCTFEQTEDDSSPAFYDLEIDGSSSMTASTAMRDVMERAQAKIRSAKESIEKKVLQTHLKLQPQSNTKTVEEKISNTVASISSCKDDRKVNCAEESSGTVLLTEERNKVIKMDQEVPDLVEQERFIDFVERTTKGRDGRETRLSYQVPLKSAQAFAWRQATEYFEVVDAGIPLKSVEQHKDETNLVHMGSDEFRNWVATEASDQKEEIKEFKAAKEAPELEEKNNKLEVAAEAWGDRIRSETASDSSCEIVFQKIAKVGLNSCEPDMDKKKMKIAKQHEEIKKLQNDSNNSAETQTRADMNVAEVDDNPRGINEKPGSNKMLNDAYTRKTKERKPKETLVMQESDTRLNEAIEQEKDGNREIMLDEKKKQEEYHKKRKNKKKQKEVCERKENEDMLKEVIKHEYDGKRPRTATEHKQYEKNLKKSFEKEENKKSEELDGSATACVEEDIEASSTVISTSRKGINVTEEASKHHELSGHPEDSGLIMRDGADRTAKLNQLRYSTMERESIKAFDRTDKLNVESNSALSFEKLDKNFGKMETQATISCGEEEELKTELKESENGIDVRVVVLGDSEIPSNTGKKCIRNVELKEKILNETIAQENNEIEERLQKERELEKEHLRKIEEEREREREREKDRMAVDRATLEARDRSRERATAELRQRAIAEAREKLEKSSLEARERSLADKASMEERIRAERAAVERWVERSVSDKFYTSSRTDEMRQSSSLLDLPGLQSQNTGTLNPLRYSYSTVHVGIESESPQRSKARLERYRRTAERAAKALAEKNLRDLVTQREQAERNRLAETLDGEVKRWSSGKGGNLRALLSTLQYILGPDSGWQPIPLTEVITSAAVKKAYRKATLCVHPDKLQQRGASIQQKYVCEKVFDLLKEAWNTFNSEEW